MKKKALVGINHKWDISKGMLHYKGLHPMHKIQLYFLFVSSTLIWNDKWVLYKLFNKHKESYGWFNF